jgi:O-antigen/teichoic acid export membrane protein
LLTNLLLLTGAGAALTLFMACGGNYFLAARFHNPCLASALLLLSPYPVLMLPASAVSACLMAQQQVDRLTAYTIISRIVLLLTVMGPAVYYATPDSAIAGTVIGAILTTPAALYLMIKACPGPTRFPSRAGLLRQLHFSVPLGLAGMVGTTSLQMGHMLVAASLPPSAFASYSVGATEVPFIGMVTGAITSVLLVDYARLYQAGDTAALIALLHRAMSKSAAILLPVMTLLLIIAPDLMECMFGSRYRDSASYFRVLLLLLPVRTITFGAVLQAMGLSRHVLCSALLGLASVTCLCYLTIREFGAIGAAWATVLSTYGIVVPYLMWVLKHYLYVSCAAMFPWRRIARLALMSCVVGLPTYLLHGNLSLGVFYRIAATSALFVVSTLVAYTITGDFRLQAILSFSRRTLGLPERSTINGR